MVLVPCLPRPPANADAAFPCDMPWYIKAGGSVCDVTWPQVFFPNVYAAEGGWLSARVASNGSFNATCSHVNRCGSVDDHIYWSVRSPAGGRGLSLHVWDALDAGLWTGSTVFTLYAYISGTGPPPVSTDSQYRASCKITSGHTGCFTLPADKVTYSVPYSNAVSDFCVDSVGSFTVTFYDDGTFS
jgi:hypothetical protein